MTQMVSLTSRAESPPATRTSTASSTCGPCALRRAAQLTQRKMAARAIALALETQGMRVAAQYRTQRPPDGTVALQAELGTEQGCVDLVRAARAALGSVDLLVHSAGIYNAGAIDEIASDKLEEMFRVNTF